VQRSVKFIGAQLVARMILVTFVFFTTTLFAGPGGKSLSIVADEWCPFNCSKDSLDQGFVIDMTKEILGAVGFDIDYRTQAWTSALDDVKAGRRDAVVGASREEAQGLVMVEEPFGENKNCFYTRLADPFVYSSVAALPVRRIAIAAGYLYGEPLDSYIASNRPNFNRIQMVTGEQPLLINIRKLESRRVDTVIENMQVMDYSLRKYRISGIRLAGCDAPTPIYMAISPKRDDAGKVASMLAIGIRKMRQSGKMRELLARYGLSDWK
jgi:polar amino acid transport system substrate-binding protein